MRVRAQVSRSWSWIFSQPKKMKGRKCFNTHDARRMYYTKYTFYLWGTEKIIIICYLRKMRRKIYRTNHRFSCAVLLHTHTHTVFQRHTLTQMHKALPECVKWRYFAYFVPLYRTLGISCVCVWFMQIAF